MATLEQRISGAEERLKRSEKRCKDRVARARSRGDILTVFHYTGGISRPASWHSSGIERIESIPRCLVWKMTKLKG